MRRETRTAGRVVADHEAMLQHLGPRRVPIGRHQSQRRRPFPHEFNHGLLDSPKGGPNGRGRGMDPHAPRSSARGFCRLTARQLPLRADEARERTVEPIQASELSFPETETRLLDRVAPGRLVGPVQLTARSVGHSQREPMPLAQSHQPTDQLLHVRRLRREFTGGALCRHVVRLD